MSRNAPRAQLPRNYQTILEAIEALEPGAHATAHDVHVRARAVQARIGFATVHRGLLRLHELGHVLKVDVPGAASAVYERTASPHAHFRCLACGEISDIDYRVPDALLAALAAEHRLVIAAQSTTFAGRCARCVSAATSVA